MQTVLVRPNDDKDIVEAYMVQHDNPKKDFSTMWYKSLEGSRKSNPEQWNINQVIRIMLNNGWQMFRLETLTVEY